MWEILNYYYNEALDYFEDETALADLFTMKYIGMAKAILNYMTYDERNKDLELWELLRDSLNNMQETVLSRRD